MSESAAMSALTNGDLAGLLASLPADETETFDVGPEGTATLVRVGRTNIRQTGPERIDLHAHDTAEEAHECYAHAVEVYRQATSAAANPLVALLASMRQAGTEVQVIDL